MRSHSIRVLSFLALWCCDLWAMGPNGTPSTPAQKTRAQRQYSHLRVPFAHPNPLNHATPNVQQTPAELNQMAAGLHSALPEDSQRFTTTGVSQIAGTGQLIASSSAPGSMSPHIREQVAAVNTLVRMRNPNIQPMLVAPNVAHTHAEGTAEHFADAYGGLRIATQGANRPACLLCETRQDSQGIQREPGYTTGRPTALWSSPDLNPQQAAQENAAHQAMLP